jgi:hypothetical protein
VNFAKSDEGKFLFLKCKEFNRTPSGEWPCSMEEDLFISASLIEQERERAAAAKRNRK